MKVRDNNVEALPPSAHPGGTPHFIKFLCRKNTAAGLALLILLIISPATASGEEFRLDREFGGSWHDAEKSSSNRNDDWLCWASAAANVLAWTGWHDSQRFPDADSIFHYYTEHWNDHPAGSPRESWRWWFQGINNSKRGAQVQKKGGSFFPEAPFPVKKWGHPPGSLFRGIGQNQLKRNPYLLRDTLQQGYGVALQIVHPLSGDDRDSHIITLWGYRATSFNRFSGILISDSDDNKQATTAVNAEDRLVYYPVELKDNVWWFTYKEQRWRILAAYGLMKRSLFQNGAWE